MMQSTGMRMMTGIAIKRAPANTSETATASPAAIMTISSATQSTVFRVDFFIARAVLYTTYAAKRLRTTAV